MGTPHKHRDVIIAWANGEKIEWMDPSGKWQKIDEPNWLEHHQYRIKPKRVKKDRWIAIYQDELVSGEMYRTCKDCMDRCPSAIAYVRIEWEEEV